MGRDEVILHAALLYAAITEESKGLYFDRGPGPWSSEDMRMYLMAYPEEVEWLSKVLAHVLTDAITYLAKERDVRYATTDIEKSRIQIMYSADKIDW